MSIRLRRIEGIGWVALCAARSVERPGDLYLDDNQDHALRQKCLRDYLSEGLDIPPNLIDVDTAAVADREESGNQNREDWERTFGSRCREGRRFPRRGQRRFRITAPSPAHRRCEVTLNHRYCNKPATHLLRWEQRHKGRQWGERSRPICSFHAEWSIEELRRPDTTLSTEEPHQ
jgi:hypothetical protein